MNKTQREFDNRDKFIELGYNIAYYRKHAGLTQEQLAERVGISRQHLGAIEAPNLVRPISLELLFNIADVLDFLPTSCCGSGMRSKKFARVTAFRSSPRFCKQGKEGSVLQKRLLRLRPKPMRAKTLPAFWLGEFLQLCAAAGA